MTIQRTEWLYFPTEPRTERAVRMKPGYRRGREGGSHNDEFHLLLRTLPSTLAGSRSANGTFEEAVQLDVFTARYDGALDESWMRIYHDHQTSRGARVFEHVGYMHEDTDVRLGREGETECMELRSSSCYATEGSGLAAETIWTVDDSREFEKVLLSADATYLLLTLDSGVWDRMLTRLREVSTALRAAHLALPKQCSCCGGTGLVPR